MENNIVEFDVRLKVEVHGQGIANVGYILHVTTEEMLEHLSAWQQGKASFASFRNHENGRAFGGNVIFGEIFIVDPETRVRKPLQIEVKLTDGEEQAELYPNSYFIPDKVKRMNMQPGEYVQLVFTDTSGTERMWVQVTEAIEGGYKGTLANDPCGIALNHGDVVEFEYRHIIKTMD